MSKTNGVQCSVEGQPFGRRWLERGLLVGMMLSAAVTMSVNLADPDLWGHVKYGRDLLRDGLPATTSYSFTAEGYRWINHENLAEILLAIGADTVGPIGLLIAKCLLGVAVLGLVLRHMLRQGVGPVAICLVGLLLAINLSYHWSLRPQLLTYTYYTLMIALLAWCFQGWEGRWRMHLFDKRPLPASEDLVYSSRRMRFLWLAPILFLLWANSHGGFVAGYCIFSTYLILRGFEAWTCRGWAARGLFARFALMIAVSGLATFVNPYGPGLHSWLLESLTMPRPEITEWHPPNLMSIISVPMWLIFVTAVIVVAFTRRSRDFTHLVLLTLTLWQSVQHGRHMPFFVIAFGFWAPIHLESILNRFHISKKDTSYGERASHGFRWVMAAGMCLAYGLLAGRLYQRLSDLPVKRDEFPVAAMQFMADHELQGRLVVTYNWAQYLIAAFGTNSDTGDGIRVAFDGRFRTCYPQEVVDMHFDLVLGVTGVARYRSPSSPAADSARVLEYGQPDLVLLNRYQPHSQEVMQQQRERWVLLYQDQTAQLWGRAATFDNPDHAHYIPPGERRISDQPQVGSVTWPALPSPDRRLDYDPVQEQSTQANPPGDSVGQNQIEASTFVGLLHQGAQVLGIRPRGNE